VDTHFRKLEEMLTKSAKECLGVTRRWSRNKKGRSRGEAEEELHNRAKEQEEEWASSWGDPEPKRRRTEKSHGGEEGEDALAEPRLRELVRQGHLRLKEEEKEKEQTDRIARGRLGRREGLNDLYKMLRNHFKGGRREPQRVVKDSQGNILTDRTEVLSRHWEGMMAKTNVDVAAGVLGERDPLSEKERTGAWRRIRAEAAKTLPPKIQARDVDVAIKYREKREHREGMGYQDGYTPRLRTAPGHPEKDPTDSYVRGLTPSGMGRAEGGTSLQRWG